MYTMLSLGLVVLWYLATAISAWIRLRHFPVPSWVAHFSYLWLAKTTYSGKQYWVHCELHKKHGPLVRIGPNEILTDDPGILREISSVRSSFTRAPWYQTGRFNPYHDNIFTLLDNAAHKKARSRTASIYSGRDIDNALELVINEQVDQLVNLLRGKYAESGEFLDLGQTTCFFSMDVITRLGFGKEFGYLKDEKDHYNFLQDLHDLWPQLSTMADVPWISRFLFSKPFLKLFGPKYTDKKGLRPLMRVAQEHVAKRFSPDAKQEQDMLGSFIDRGMTKEECEVEGLFMIVAGLESTASSLRSILTHTITSPRVYNKIKQEIHDAVTTTGVSTPITNEEAKRLPYLQALIYEGIRMRPPILGLFPKVVPSGGIEFHGKYLSAGTNICTNMSSLLRSKTLFGPDAELFRPERFIDVDEEKRVEMQRNVDLVFGYGQWQCLGKPISSMEINKAIYELLRNFDFQLINPGKPCEVQSYGVFLESGLRVKVSEHTIS